MEASVSAAATRGLVVNQALKLCRSAGSSVKRWARPRARATKAVPGTASRRS
jgi:hypothetical protein